MCAVLVQGLSASFVTSRTLKQLGALLGTPVCQILAERPAKIITGPMEQSTTTTQGLSFGVLACERIGTASQDCGESPHLGDSGDRVSVQTRGPRGGVATTESAWSPRATEEVVSIAEVADWRLPDQAFLAIFRLPRKTQEGRLQRANAFPREQRVSFDEESHRYTIDDGIVAPRSVTSLLHAYVDPFDPARAISSMRQSIHWEARRAELEAQCVDTDRDENIGSHWQLMGEIARSRGTLLHFHAEQAVNGRCVEEPHSPEFAQVLLLLREFVGRGWAPWRAEVNIFHCGLRCAGQPDLLCKDTAGRLVIVDWKRVPKLSYENRYTALRYPLQHLPNSSYWLYALQLNTYRFFLETEYEMSIASMWLGVVHPNLRVPRLVEIPRMENEMEAILEHEITSGRATRSRPLDTPFTLI